MKERIYRFDNIKLLLIFLVIIGHAISPVRGVARWVDFLWPFLRSFTMPLFFVTSGYFYKKRSVRYSLKRFLYPCVLFTVFLWGWGYIFYPAWRESIPFLEPAYCMWFFWCMFFYYVITPFLIEMLHVNLYLLLAGSFVFTWVVGLIPYIGSTFQLSRLVCFYPYFLLGILLREKYHSHIENQSSSKYVACAWGGVLLCMLIWFVAETVNPGIVYTTGFTGGYGLSLNGVVERIFCQILCTLECLLMLLAVPNKKYFFTKFGERTLTPYVLHMFIVFPLCWTILYPYRDSILCEIAMIFISVILCLPFFSNFVKRLLEKYLHIS